MLYLHHMTLDGLAQYKTAGSFAIPIFGSIAMTISGSMRYILVDKGGYSRCNASLAEFVMTGYPHTHFLIQPFTDYNLTQDPVKAIDWKRWNCKLSSLHVLVEHVFGRLKGKFPILRCLPSRKLQDHCMLIEALMIVHNILEEYGDDPETIRGFNGKEDDDVRDVVGEAPLDLLDEDELYNLGLLRRKHLVEYEGEHIREPWGCVLLLCGPFPVPRRY